MTTHVSPVSTPLHAWMLLLPLALVLVRGVFAGLIELFPDEAYYWAWSRTPAGGYFDHPPLVAWLIAASTWLFGTHELTVRLPAILLAGASVLAAGEMVRQLGATARTILYLQLLLVCLPMVHVQGLVITPDAPAAFFVLLMLLAAIHCLRTDAFTWWLTLGITAGLAMLSKYTTLLPVGAAFIYLLIARPVAWPRLILAGVIASAVLTPLFAWNAAHEWASFRFQLGHGTTPDDRGALLNLGDYVGGQLLIATPILAPLFVYAAIGALRATPAHRLIAIPCLVTLSFFALSSLSHKVEANWPSQAWLPLAVLLAVALPNWSPRLQQFARSGLIVATVITFGLHLPQGLLARVRGPHSTTGGWRSLAERIHTEAAGRSVYCTRYQDAALFAFYLPGRPEVPLLRTRSRLSHYDYILLPPFPPEFILLNNAPFEVGDASAHHASDEIAFEVISTGHCRINLDRIQTRERYFAVCRPLQRDDTAHPR